MNIYLLSALIFAFGYLINMFYISVLYHRGLTHGAVKLSPGLYLWTIKTGNWVTGIDPKAWACMHRLHHQHSDTVADPHSPTHQGVFGVVIGQLESYKDTLRGLIKGKAQYCDVVKDFEFPVHWLNQKKTWLLPYFSHLIIAIALAFYFSHWLVGLAFLVGISSHPIQGWMVNALAHRFGYSNYENGDQSRNNTFVAWACMGEGYQNNHHAHPASAKFSRRWFEFDAGYVLCVISAKLKLMQLNEKQV